MPPKTFVITCSNGFEDARNALLKRGWREVKDPEYQAFDLKWSLKAKDVTFRGLRPQQIVNHFQRSQAVTTKNGLMYTLQCLPWFEQADPESFFPRSFDLAQDGEMDAFTVEFKWSAATAILKCVQAQGGISECTVPSASVVDDAMRVCEQHLKFSDYLVSSCDGEVADRGVTPLPNLSEAAWDALLNCPYFTTRTTSSTSAVAAAAAAKVQQSAESRPNSSSSSCSSGRAGGGAARPWSGLGTGVGGARGGSARAAHRSRKGSGRSGTSKPSASAQRKRAKARRRILGPFARNENEDGEDKDESDDEGEGEGEEAAAAAEAEVPAPAQHPPPEPAVERTFATYAEVQTPIVALPEAMRQRVEELLQRLGDPVRFPGAYVEGRLNTWVVKPSGKSRGRNIRLFNNLHDLKTHIEGGVVGADKAKQDAKAEGAAEEGGPGGGDRESQMEFWVVQKYIERPLLAYGRKMDIRAWVMVTDWSPLTIWFYNDVYVRFAAEDYQTWELGNVFQHLTNNSIAKYSKESHVLGENNMWYWEQMDEYLQATGGGEVWEQMILPAMKRISRQVLVCAQGTVEPRKNSFELFGFDFLIDEACGVWLLEVNSSPALDHSTSVTGKLCASMLDDLMKVVIDLPEWRQRQRDLRPASPSRQARSSGPASPSKAPAEPPPDPDAPPPGSLQAQDPGLNPGLNGGGGSEAGTPEGRGKQRGEEGDIPEGRGKQRGEEGDIPGYFNFLDTGAWECVFRGDAEEYKMPPVVSNLMVSGRALDMKDPAGAAAARKAQRHFAAQQAGKTAEILAEAARARKEEEAAEEARMSKIAAMHSRARRITRKMAISAHRRMEAKRLEAIEQMEQAREELYGAEGRDPEAAHAAESRVGSAEAGVRPAGPQAPGPSAASADPPTSARPHQSRQAHASLASGVMGNVLASPKTYGLSCQEQRPLTPEEAKERIVRNHAKRLQFGNNYPPWLVRLMRQQAEIDAQHPNDSPQESQISTPSSHASSQGRSTLRRAEQKQSTQAKPTMQESAIKQGYITKQGDRPPQYSHNTHMPFSNDIPKSIPRRTTIIRKPVASQMAAHPPVQSARVQDTMPAHHHQLLRRQQQLLEQQQQAHAATSPSEAAAASQEGPSASTKYRHFSHQHEYLTKPQYRYHAQGEGFQAGALQDSIQTIKHSKPTVHHSQSCEAEHQAVHESSSPEQKHLPSIAKSDGVPDMLHPALAAGGQVPASMLSRYQSHAAGHPLQAAIQFKKQQPSFVVR